MTRAWTPEQIDALGVRTDLQTAGSILGFGRTKTYDLLKRNELPFSVIKIGSRYAVAVMEIKRLLGLAPPLAETPPAPEAS